MRLRFWLFPVAAVVSLFLFPLGCHKPAQPADATRQYPIRGNIVSVDAASGHIELNHEAVPGLMEAMEMPYKLEDPSVVSELHPGDRITAVLAVDEDSAGPRNMRLRDIVVIAQAKPDYKPKAQYHVPTAGETVPDFKLLNQSDHTISVKQFQGKVLLLTFIYTRCPLADFCPRMSKNFAELDKALAGDKALYAKTHLLSVSFDPTYDTPKVLRSYGGAYTGRYVNETFTHWDFAAPSVKELPAMEQWFAVGVTPGEGNAPLQHTLATVLIGKDGKVLQYYNGNDWTVDEVLAKVRAAV
ncbi:MAG TPA: SCO family protein [Acidobacteriaceae bacterium]